MNRWLRQKGILNHLSLSLFLMFLSCAIFSGCEPLRKKFIRQKKKSEDINQVMPVLVPEEYPAPVQTRQEQYRYHYSLWGVWTKEFLTVIEEPGRDKRLRYVLEQMMIQLGQMKQLADEDKKALFGPYESALLEAKKQFLQPSAFRNPFVMKSKIVKLDRDFRRQLKF